MGIGHAGIEASATPARNCWVSRTTSARPRPARLPNSLYTDGRDTSARAATAKRLTWSQPASQVRSRAASNTRCLICLRQATRGGSGTDPPVSVATSIRCLAAAIVASLPGAEARSANRARECGCGGRAVVPALGEGAGPAPRLGAPSDPQGSGALAPGREEEAAAEGEDHRRDAERQRRVGAACLCERSACAVRLQPETPSVPSPACTPGEAAG